MDADPWLIQRNSDWLEGRSSVARGHLVLIVEDSESDLFFLLRAFSASKVSNPIRAIRTGEEAKDYLAGAGKFADRSRFPLPKIVILDMRMPGLDGYELLRWSKSQPKFRDTLFVAVSNFTHLEEINRAYQSGADTFLSKPLDPHDISNLIEGFEQFWQLRGSDDSGGPLFPPGGAASSMEADSAIDPR